MPTVIEKLLHLGNHLLPILITVAIIAVCAAFVIGRPYLKHIFLVSNADTKEGINELAKELAKEVGGKHIETESIWKGFVTAATKLRLLHMDRVEDLTRTDR